MAHHRDKPDLGKFLGQQIAAHRIALNLTQNQLAERLGVEPETVSRFERGSSLPSLKRLIALSEVLDVGVHRLLSLSSPLAKDQCHELEAMLTKLAPNDRTLVLSIVKTLSERLMNTIASNP